ncbi:Immunogenic protein MPT63 [Mycobacterium simulans]|uniref:Immunogenic protein MPT63 n=1 Tax=Mycobacterium simulans TaxID=627089 RepID=A0A7Z7IKN1_9MYCO|nr:MPT63 family protein [Mycobacterium simulans]SOJ54394.1 Immunogenic protein MPT63 [Mycobacterium simulans]SON62487.1 Immunogenic protein MPT63 [Mycobacterium simulans]
MKFTKTAVKTAIGAAGIAAAAFTAATAIAIPSVQQFGTSAPIVSGPLVTAYTVHDLEPTNMTIPGYAPQGQLWQAEVTAVADSGTVTPLVSSFNARTATGQNYRVVNNVPAPAGINPSPIPQGGQTSGKIFFDVTGAPPNGVVYNDGVQDVLIWTNNA